ncbi:H+transporting two-sector ATPase B/B' subunit [Ancylobacter novellus DSM 506]|uniref:ATP synthase subunit b n=1 Tax=Ancylobacter novellus (strain ATCC 8093 / DSM 506 / JCM 20403 / CCM 1077 / IAM 12100 / NBRC 12443 / NCIMB 10456) TaxID=639283 RepID=D7A3R3_ANCN5|nr:F0F1 ATP synthase subunit B [Ancylobacter novellus]ADH91690.1 H+transporting two-sector ATPase B/B' subunit [Ancylobacter novellus DSM 506]
MGSDTLWVAVAFVIFMAIVARAGAFSGIAAKLDARGERIRHELEEARKLKEEAQKLVAEYKRRQREAEDEAEAIITTAKAEAERLAAETKAKLEDMIARRTKMAEQKIAQAEAQALADVKAAAADAAVKAAETLLAAQVVGETAERVLGEAVSEVKSKLN